MKIFRSLEEVPQDFGPSLVTVGNFDGVHCGHREVLREVAERARSVGCKTIAVTFDPHPIRLLRPDLAPKLITPQPIKEALLQEAGLDALLVIPFTREFSMMPAVDFARNILAGKLRAKEVHEGENFQFGYKAEGNVERLIEFGREMGFSVKTCHVRMVRGETVSSSQIRKLIAAGKVARARRLLGRTFSLTATSDRGRGYGSKYTVPTINLGRYDELVPGNGVYLTRTRVGAEVFNSITNVGTRPTFGDNLYAIETHLLDFHPIELTPETEVEVSFLLFRRPEIKFPSVDALREQIGKDVLRAKRYFQLERAAAGAS
ncbi:MAG TPA: riboflavin biosynthesis protein RibF [Candidatus Angelobacter sp.]|nr:riboflavin biosynthesis protein RibF [Candidatus Angelobacter sp.]